LKRAFGYSEVPSWIPSDVGPFRLSNPRDYWPDFRGTPQSIETVTYMIEGSWKHGDSIGTRGINSGEINDDCRQRHRPSGDASRCEGT